MKKQLPDFMGTDPVGWIASAESFFEKNEVPSRDKLQWAFMSMEDKQAMMWFYYWCEENPDAEWESFSKAMMVRFGTQSEPSQEKSLPENQEIQLELGEASEATEDVVLLAFSNDGREAYVTKAGSMFNEALSETQRSENERVNVFDSLPITGNHTWKQRGPTSPDFQPHWRPLRSRRTKQRRARHFLHQSHQIFRLRIHLYQS
ncbi:unnamed protein product [Trifolium pratense]|uniref:Uncharacterized protein n=1 Tax=Trifolium pratense TaxID=57577 RepID=A0ACB0LIN5_TRIPR|nr:unnamed protein product [Trifolium pratense]